MTKYGEATGNNKHRIDSYGLQDELKMSPNTKIN